VSLLGAHANVLKPELLNSLTRETSSQVVSITRAPSAELQYGDPTPALDSPETLSANEPRKSQIIPHRHLCSGMTTDYADAMTTPNVVPVGQAPSNPVAQSILPGVRADGILNTFRERFAPQFPFIIVPMDIDSKSLHTGRPWVYRAIMLIGNDTHRAVQVETSKRIALDVLEALTLRGERSLDMLQGLLLHNAW
jgi:hypothetical protein